jgi:dihydrolipoamide dehydrogenase
MKAFDVVVIGAGPAGYTTAIRCAQLGLSTACVDRWLDPDDQPVVGGSCVNAGCIPSKVLLEASEDYARLMRDGGRRGLRFTGLEPDLAALQAHKHRIIDEVGGTIRDRFKQHRVNWIPGDARLLGDMRVEVARHQDAGKGKKQTIQASAIVIATGSMPTPLAAAPVDGQRIVDSTGALAFDEIPKRLAIIGAGVIGLEMGSIWNRLGAKVILLEAQEEFLPLLDRELAAAALQEFSDQGLDIRTGARVTSTHPANTLVRIKYKDADGEHELKTERLVVAVGRRPLSCDLCTEESGLQVDEGGYIRVDEYCHTDVNRVYAIGDAVRGPMLAHKGMEEGLAVAETIAGEQRSVNYRHIPWVMYTSPELAWGGATEAELQAQGTDYRIGRFPFAANHRARVLERGNGIAKVLSDARSDALLGVHLMGAGASELINEAVLALEFAASAEDLARTCHAHPTLSEVLQDAAIDNGLQSLQH